MRVSVFWWTIALLCASQWEWWCAHTAYDHRASTVDCVRLKGSAECVGVQPLCLSPSVIRWASPRWLSNLAGYGGPLLTWLPLLVAKASVRNPRTSLIGPTLVWYLAFIGVVRHTHLLLSSRWDPSGHCFVYGAQLLPLWAVSRLPNQNVPWLITLWSWVLLYLSGATAAFFHTPSETGAAWLLLLLLHGLLLTQATVMQAAASFGPEAAAAEARREWARLYGRGALVLPVWLLCTAAAWELTRRRGGAVDTIAMQAAYDAALWGLLLLLLRRGERRLAQPGGTAEDAVLKGLGARAPPSDAGSDERSLRSREVSPNRG